MKPNLRAGFISLAILALIAVVTPLAIIGAGIAYTSITSSGTFLTPKTAVSTGIFELGDFPNCWPVGGIITQLPYPYSLPGLTHTNSQLNAFDIGTGPSNPPVYSSHAGEVVRVNFFADDYGQYVVIRGQTTSGEVFHTYYAHLVDGGVEVQEGQTVDRGTLIGYANDTGHSTAPHLHYELRGAQIGPGMRGGPNMMELYPGTSLNTTVTQNCSL